MSGTTPNFDQNAGNGTHQGQPKDGVTSALDSFAVGDWQVDVAANRLYAGDQEVKIESKVMDVLVYLTKRSGELVTREELERDVWAGRVVGYESLTSNINKLRKALNDDSRKPRYIETVSKKGYRLIAPVSFATVHEQPADDTRVEKQKIKSGWWPVWIAVLTVIVSVTAYIIVEQSGQVGKQTRLPSNGAGEAARTFDMSTPSLVVLPFVDISSDVAQRYLGDGLTEDVTTALSKLSGLFVIARSSAMIYRDQAVDVKAVARQLHVHYVLEGSVQREGNQLRVNAKLIDGDSGFHLWAESYDREVKDIFSVQDDITRKIVRALSITLTEQEQRRAASQYTVSFDAYENFLKGQDFYVRHTPEDNLRAREMFDHSIELDPGFARAFSAKALTYTAEFRYGWKSEGQDVLALALQLAQKAVSIDNQLPQAYYVLGYVNLLLRQYTSAIAAAKRAIELNPNFADGYATLGVSYVYDGNPQQGMLMMQRAMRLNPQYPAPYASALGQAYYFLGRYEEALPILREAVERNVSLLTSHVFLIATLSRLGQKDEANWAAVQFKTLVPNFNVEKVGEMFPFKDQEDLQAVTADLRRAGL